MISSAALKAGAAAIANPEAVKSTRIALAPTKRRRRDFGGGGGVPLARKLSACRTLFGISISVAKYVGTNQVHQLTVDFYCSPSNSCATEGAMAS